MIWATLNIIFSWWAWRSSTSAFEDKQNGLGWFMIFVSAINFAAALVQMGF